MLTLDGLKIQQGAFEMAADLVIETGSKVAVIGPSGAGKSSLLATIAGFLEPASGRVLWNDSDITAMDPGVRPLSIIFQDNNLFPHLTVAQNVGLGLRAGLRLSSVEQDQVQGSLEKVGLTGFESRKPAALSGGQQSRVVLARTLVRARPLMLLDEPFAALGPALKTEMLDLVSNLANQTGATVLMVTHDPKDAERLADQTILVADGLVRTPEDTGSLLANPPPSLRSYLN